jgi:chaperonin cofactor prefoldin
MKKIFVLSMLISVGMICSCQKQDTAAEQQLAQRKAELDAREKALAEREKAIAGPRRILPNLQSRGQVRDPAQLKAERDRRLQQLPRDVQALIPDRSRIQEQLAQRQRRLEELQRMRMPAGAAPPAAGATSRSSLAASPAAEATSPSPSPTPQ